MFPVYIKDEKFQQPEDPIYYLVTADGVFLVKNTQFFTCATKVGSIPNLKKHKEELILKLPGKIPADQLRRVVAFFQKVYQMHQAEAAVVIYYSPEEAEYSLVVPDQKVSGASAHYTVKGTPDGLLRVGEFHSHARMKASHSGIDDADEEHDDGLHITIGNLDTIPSYSCSMVVDGKRYSLDLSDVVQYEEEAEIPDEWLARVKATTTSLASIGGRRW